MKYAYLNFHKYEHKDDWELMIELLLVKPRLFYLL